MSISIELIPFSFLEVHNGPRAKASMPAACCGTDPCYVKSFIFNEAVIDCMMFITSGFLGTSSEPSNLPPNCMYLFHFCCNSKVCLVCSGLGHKKLAIG